MKSYWILGAAVAALSFANTGCGHDQEDPPEILDFTVTPDSMNAGDTIEGYVEVINFDLHNHDEGEPDHIDNNSGHFHVYLDDLMTNPIAMPDVNPFDIDMPADATPGQHTLIVRLQRADHTILVPEVTFEATITVQ